MNWQIYSHCTSIVRRLVKLIKTIIIGIFDLNATTNDNNTNINPISNPSHYVRYIQYNVVSIGLSIFCLCVSCAGSVYLNANNNNNMLSLERSMTHISYNKHIHGGWSCPARSFHHQHRARSIRSSAASRSSSSSSAPHININGMHALLCFFFNFCSQPSVAFCCYCRIVSKYSILICAIVVDRRRSPSLARPSGRELELAYRRAVASDRF